jgi:hypothetical protein
MSGQTGNRAPRTQIFQVSTLYGAATVAAALDAGQFGPRSEARRVLLTTNNARIPETATALPELAGWDGIVARFDAVVDWNELISPYHPSDWHPGEKDAVLWQRVLRRAWDLGPGPMDLVVESVHARPATALTSIFADADIHVYADGLMSYGPTRDRMAWPVACRVRRLLHLDLIPGLRPLLLTEFDVPAEIVPDDRFRAVLAEIADAEESAQPVLQREDGGSVAVLLGQYLAALDILTPEEEEELHVRMLRGAARAGHRTIVFKPHPSAPARYSQALEKAAADSGVRLRLVDRPMLAETVVARLRPELVVGCFSTAMLTASVYFGARIARVGTETVLERLQPYQNSNRIPLTIVDAVVAPLDQATESFGMPTAHLTPLLQAVGYCMQPKIHPQLRGTAEQWLSTHQGDERVPRYFLRSRLTSLARPGGFAASLTRQLPGGHAALRIARKVRRTAIRSRA